VITVGNFSRLYAQAELNMVPIFTPRNRFSKKTCSYVKKYCSDYSYRSYFQITF